MAKRFGFRVKFYGVRGTIACPGPATCRYGGNTACVEVCCGDRRLILDAGTGIRVLGNELIRNSAPHKAHIFLTHTHVDHIIGLPFFKPAYETGNRFELWSGHLKRRGNSLSNVLQHLMESPYFPVKLDIMQSCIAYRDFDAGIDLQPWPEVLVRTLPLNHPGGATAYRVEYQGRSFCYITDTEHPAEGRDQALVDFIAGSDIVVYDSTYTDQEYPRYRGWGHSTWQEGVRLCEAAGVSRFVAFHHDPDHDDDRLDEIGGELAEARPGSLIAREGMVLEL